MLKKLVYWLLFPFLLAFSIKSRRIIQQRTKDKSEISGNISGQMECAHLNHDKNNLDYDNPENGKYVTIIEHYAQHLIHIGIGRCIGLTEEVNKYAIQQILKRMKRPPSKKQINNTVQCWLEYYKQHSNTRFKPNHYTLLLSNLVILANSGIIKIDMSGILEALKEESVISKPIEI
ncbi:MAG: hypothetical protein NZZ41_05010 [Candidatus Dojkabacteria bacterium]|nr:hypothetical protein [Candidatus Dojkabacteria bacterium]